MSESPARILHLEDDPTLLRIVRQHLTHAGFEVDSLLDPAEFSPETASSYDLLILDLVMPGKNGLEVGDEARKAGFEQGILLLTSMGLDRDQQIELERLEGHYMTKPFGPQHLLTRVRQLLVDVT
ncbi:MAG: response regulator transcription factor [Planctomycetota bacterium]|jgi:DNA-binding response OmpR family regulator